MALKFKQYRYFGADNINNSGVSLVNNQITFMNWPSGTIKRIGIQTMPGVEFNIMIIAQMRQTLLQGLVGLMSQTQRRLAPHWVNLM